MYIVLCRRRRSCRPHCIKSLIRQETLESRAKVVGFVLFELAACELPSQWILIFYFLLTVLPLTKYGKLVSKRKIRTTLQLALLFYTESFPDFNQWKPVVELVQLIFLLAKTK